MFLLEILSLDLAILLLETLFLVFDVGFIHVVVVNIVVVHGFNHVVVGKVVPCCWL